MPNCILFHQVPKKKIVIEAQDNFSQIINTQVVDNEWSIEYISPVGEHDSVKIFIYGAKVNSFDLRTS